MRTRQKAFTRAALGIFLLTLACALPLSCSRRVGWGVLLWPGTTEAERQTQEESGNAAPELGLDAGSVFPIYLKSNIQKVYVIGMPKDKSSLFAQARAEVAQWKVGFYSSKAKAKAFAKEFAPCKYTFAIALRDGLPVRSKPDANAERLYRLHEQEMVKVIKKAKGGAVTNGKGSLAGEWYLVLTADGTQGYAFSNTLKLYDYRTQNAQSAAADTGASPDATFATILSHAWRPLYYQTMAEKAHVNLDAFQMKYGFFGDLPGKKVRIELANQSYSASFSGYDSPDGRTFKLDGAPVTIRLLGADQIEVTFPAKEPADQKTSAAPNRVEKFCNFTEDFSALIRAENARQQGVLDELTKKGGDFISDSCGTLSLTRSGRFTWKNPGDYADGILPADCGETGKIQFNGTVTDELSSTYNGVVTLTFDKAPSTPVRLLYTNIAGGLRLENLPGDGYDELLAVGTKKPDSPKVAFFSFSNS